MTRAALALAAAWASASTAAALDAGNSCPYAHDGECDEPGYSEPYACDWGTDSYDCRRDAAMGSNSCYWAHNGECDDPAGGDAYCPFNTDVADCRRARFDSFRMSSEQRVFFGRDDRNWAPSRDAPWSAIGRLSFESGGTCTGTLVSARVVLSAAHCFFYDQTSRRRDAPTKFQAGLDGLNVVAEANVVDSVLAEGFDNIRHMQTNEINGLDFGFAILDRPIGTRAGVIPVYPLTVADLREVMEDGGTIMMQAGYSADSAFRLSANLDCSLVEIFDDDTFFHECDTLAGDSGSPFLAAINGDIWVIGVESSTLENPAGPYDFNLAVDARAFHDDYLRVVLANE